MNYHRFDLHKPEERYLSFYLCSPKTLAQSPVKARLLVFHSLMLVPFSSSDIYSPSPNPLWAPDFELRSATNQNSYCKCEQVILYLESEDTDSCLIMSPSVKPTALLLDFGNADCLQLEYSFLHPSSLPCNLSQPEVRIT